MCSNVKHYREDFVQKHVLDEIRRRFRNYESSEYLRKRIATLLGEQERSTRAEREQRARDLEGTNGRIRNLVAVLGNGLDSRAVREELQELEKSAAHLKASIALLNAEATEPVRMPSHHEVRAYVDDLDGALARDPLGAREALRRLFGAPLKLRRQDDGQCVVEGSFFPMAVLAPETTKPRESGASWYNSSCAGRI